MEYTKWTEQEIELLKEKYYDTPKEELDKLFPNHSHQSILAKASKLKLPKISTKWSEENLDLLRKYYMEMPIEETRKKLTVPYSVAAISTQAAKIGLKRTSLWSKEEEDIMTDYYPILPIDEIAAMLPKRKRKNIIMKACTMGLKQSGIFWTEEEEQYIKDNWELLSDYEMSLHLNHTVLAVKRRRDFNLKLYRTLSEDQTYNYSLSHFIRANITEWKKASMEQCNYKCIITGNKNFEIHHLVNLSKMLAQALNNLGMSQKGKVARDFTESERQAILQEFIKIQNDNPLGMCIESSIHALFHSLYGQFNNTPEQFYHFVEEYKKETFKEIA